MAPVLHERIKDKRSKQIRGGEAAALVRLSTRPVDVMDDDYDILFAIDWLNIDRFAAEIPLRADGIVIGDAAAGDVPTSIAAGGAQTLTVAVAEILKEVAGGRPNMVALGAVHALTRTCQTAKNVAATTNKADFYACFAHCGDFSGCVPQSFLVNSATTLGGREGTATTVSIGRRSPWGSTSAAGFSTGRRSRPHYLRLPRMLDYQAAKSSRRSQAA